MADNGDVEASEERHNLDGQADSAEEGLANGDVDSVEEAAVSQRRRKIGGVGNVGSV